MLNVEELRVKLGMSVKDFAEAIGMKQRTYEARIYDEQPIFKIDELQRIAELNDGHIRVVLPNGRFDVTFEKVN